MSGEENTRQRKPIIAFIVSTSVRTCHDFLYFHHLNPELFICANEIVRLQGVAIATPIILVQGPRVYDPGKQIELEQFCFKRFLSVRYMDY